MLKTIFFIVSYILTGSRLFAQTADSIHIDQSEIKDILSFLASDSLKGRGNYTIELAKAANYIAKKFTAIGLEPFMGWPTLHQPFQTFDKKAVARDIIQWNTKELDAHDFIYLTTEIIPTTKTLADFKIIEIENTLPDSFFYYNSYDSGVLIWIKKKLSKKEDILPNTAIIRTDLLKHNILIVANENRPEKLLLHLNTDYYKNMLLNIVGVLPGKSKSDEVVIFSAHYDHLGAEIKRLEDGIYNGANDNASGLATLLMLAQYYAKESNNERTLIFCAFAGEELGLIGSRVFVNYVDPKTVKAVINMDMVGIPQNGKKHIFITGASYSNFADIFRKELFNSHNNFIVDFYESEDMFKRSDNYSFAVKGIPAHNFMSIDDRDPCYHKPCDEVNRLDIPYMEILIKAIIQGCGSIISNKTTPSRINTARLQSEY